MKNFVVYHKLTGEILRNGYAPASMIEIQAVSENEAVIEATGMDDAHFVDIDQDPPVVAQRQAMALTVTHMTGGGRIEGLPSCVVSWKAQQFVVTDGVADLTFEEPGVYKVNITPSPRYLGEIVEIDAR